MRIADGAMAPRVCAGDYVWVDPDEPATDGCLVAVRDPGCGGETVVRLFVERDARVPERTIDAGNETDIRGVVVFVATRSDEGSPCQAAGYSDQHS